MTGGPHEPASRCPDCHAPLGIDQESCSDCEWYDGIEDARLAAKLPDGMTLEDLPNGGPN